MQHGYWEAFLKFHMKKGFANSTSSCWNADAFERTSYGFKIVKGEVDLNPSDYQGTPTDYCKGQAGFDAGPVPSQLGL